jgi:hypothetical protein
MECGGTRRASMRRPVFNGSGWAMRVPRSQLTIVAARRSRTLQTSLCASLYATGAQAVDKLVMNGGQRRRMPCDRVSRFAGANRRQKKGRRGRGGLNVLEKQHPPAHEAGGVY